MKAYQVAGESSYLTNHREGGRRKWEWREGRREKGDRRKEEGGKIEGEDAAKGVDREKR